MANPQLEHGYIRIANELWDEIIRRDFSKRQKDILLFIWRLSYGCQHKHAYIPKMRYFQLCGVSETKIKEELEYLERCRVLIWDRVNKTFEIEKDYESWYVSLVKSWNEEVFNELLALNLSLRTSQNGKENFPKRETDLPKKGNSNFPKRETREALNPYGSKVEEGSKDIIKDSIKYKEEEEENQNPFIFFEQNGFGTLSPYIADELNYWIDGNFFDEPEIIIIRAMKEALLRNSRRWKYVDSILRDWNNSALKTLRDVEAHIESFEQNRNKTSFSSGKRRDALSMIDSLE